MREYSAYFSELAAEYILGLPKRRQRMLFETCKQLAKNPFVRSDYSIRDTDGREIEHIRVAGFVIAYWVDSPVYQVMIVEIDDIRSRR